MTATHPKDQSTAEYTTRLVLCLDLKLSFTRKCRLPEFHYDWHKEYSDSSGEEESDVPETLRGVFF